jgi:hypothetical protein
MTKFPSKFLCFKAPLKEQCITNGSIKIMKLWIMYHIISRQHATILVKKVIPRSFEDRWRRT